MGDDLKIDFRPVVFEFPRTGELVVFEIKIFIVNF